MAKDSEQGAEPERRYRAPALEKGLDILELLASSPRPLTVSMISQKLGRSMSELFRMVQVLEFRGFIEQSPNGRGYRPTDKLLLLGMEQSPTKDLLDVSLPIMRELSARIGQSCHLAVRSGGDIVIVARVESAEQIGFTVRIGYRKSLALTRSGAVLLAFQDDGVREQWLSELAPEITPEQVKELRARLKLIRSRGYDRAKSDFVTGITDLSAPILRGSTAIAALTVPFVHSTQLSTPIDGALEQLRAAASEISASLLLADHHA